MLYDIKILKPSFTIYSLEKGKKIAALSIIDKIGYLDEERAEGFQFQKGIHTFIMGIVPFIPSFRNINHSVSISKSQNEIIAQSQIQFLSNLANSKAFKNCTFNLRFISSQKKSKLENDQIDIIIIVKTFSPIDITLNNINLDDLVKENEQKAKIAWSKLNVHFPKQEPLNYPLEAISDTNVFLSHFQPFSKTLLPENLLEIKKFEDYDLPMENREEYLKPNKLQTAYYSHSFSPSTDNFGSIYAIFSTLLSQSKKAVLSITLKPTELKFNEVRLITNIMEICENKVATANSNNIANLNFTKTEGGVGSGKIKIGPSVYLSQRAEEVTKAYTKLLNNRHRLFCMKIQVLGEDSASEAIAEAVGSAVICHHDQSSQLWELYSPTSNTINNCLYNFVHLEFLRPTSKIENTDTLERIPYLVTTDEAFGIFKLPAPPESGFIPGVHVKDEPFVQPTIPLTNLNSTSEYEVNKNTINTGKIKLGEIVHRGVPTGKAYEVDIKYLARHCLVAGSTGSGKTNTCLNLLEQLWYLGQSFLVMYPVDKPDYRTFMSNEKVNEKLLIYTVGDDTVSPFRFNPFYVPEGILLRTHLNSLMRCFSSAFYMWDVLPSIYRNALRKVYLKAGWARSPEELLKIKGGEVKEPAPTLVDFYYAVQEAANEETSGIESEYMGNIRQGAISRVKDLLFNVGHVLNTPDPGPFGEILNRPVVMELGKIGSSEDTALIMAFLLTSLVEELQSRKNKSTKKLGTTLFRQHVTLLEEAHRLMPANSGSSGNEQADTRSKASEEFSNLLAEVRGFGESIIIAEQIPTSLVTGAIANTHIKIMHWLENPQDVDLFGKIMNLNENQLNRVRTLVTGEGIVRDESGLPVHIRVEEYNPKTNDDNIVDQEVSDFMKFEKRDIPKIPKMSKIPNDILGVFEPNTIILDDNNLTNQISNKVKLNKPQTRKLSVQ